MKSVSVRVRLARRTAHLTQADVAKLLGVGRSAVAQWERPVGSRPSISHLTALAQTLNCSLEWLATGRGGRGCDSPSVEDGEEAAVITRHFAHDDEEERILAVFRNLDKSDREIIIVLADALALKAVTHRKSKRV